MGTGFNGWLYQLPPWRAPRLRRRYRVGLIDAFALMIGWFLYALFWFEIWMLEAFLWAGVWSVIGVFYGVRWMWRHNPIGQTIDSRHAVAERRRARPRPADQYADPIQPIDLSQLGTMRRRS